jgi:hypothetical protein
MSNNECDDKLNEQLERLSRVVEEDHKLLKGMYKRARWANAFRITYWSIIVLAALGAYVWLQPYVDRLKGAYNSITHFTSGMGDNGSADGVFLKIKEFFVTASTTKK